jgi:hypothetical protein
VGPLFGCQCSSLHKEDADELVKRWNEHEVICGRVKTRVAFHKQRIADWSNPKMAVVPATRSVRKGAIEFHESMIRELESLCDSF